MAFSRRSFLRTSASAGVVLGVAPNLLFSADGVPPSEQVQIGLIGCKNKGWEILEYHLRHGGVRCVALCDVDQTILNDKAAAVEKNFSQKPALYGDYRKLLEHKGLDAVIIGTPDHWHCLPLVHACEAGLDVYVEKPLANSIAECDIMVKAVRRYKRVAQVGQQQRSGDSWRSLMAFIHGGALGKLRKVNIWANFNYGVGRKKEPDMPVPAGVDFETWLGPAPKRSFNPGRFHGSWRMFWAYGGGLMTDWGVHLIDMALWAGKQDGDPTEVLAYGKNLSFPDFAHETFDTMSVVYPMSDYVINWQHTAGTQQGPYGMNYGLEFVGDNGTAIADRRGWKFNPEGSSTLPRQAVPAKSDVTASDDQSMEAHVADFLSCVKSRKEPACPIETGRQVAVFAHVANIAARTNAGRLVWDGAKQRFTNSDEANRLVTPEYRQPWALPKV